MISAKELMESINKGYREPVVVLAKDMPKLRFLPTGVFELDVALGGGLAFNRINEIFGEPSSCKTTIAWSAAAEFQKLCPGGVVLYIDAERTFDPTYMSTLGVDPQRTVIYDALTGEEAGDVIVKAMDSHDALFIIVDSIASLRPVKELQEDTDKSLPGIHPRLVNRVIARMIPRLKRRDESQVGHTVLLLNQTRQKIGVLFGDPTTPSGGKGREFMISQQIFVKRVKWLREKGDHPGEASKRRLSHGLLGLFEVRKNKTGSGPGEGEFIYYLKRTGLNPAFTFDNAKSMFNLGLVHGVVKKVSLRSYQVVGVPGSWAKSERTIVEQLHDETMASEFRKALLAITVADASTTKESKKTKKQSGVKSDGQLLGSKGRARKAGTRSGA